MTKSIMSFLRKRCLHLFRCHCVSLAYNWDDVNLIVQLLHKLDVQGFQPWERSRVTKDNNNKAN